MEPHELYRVICDAKYTKGRLDLDYTIFHKDGKMYLLFQSTHSALDWAINVLSSIPLLNRALGWQTVYFFNCKAIFNELKECMEKSGCKEAVVAGHSYGGAIAVYAGIDFIRKTGIKPELVTFGAPKCLLAGITPERHFSSVRQYANRNDLVAHLPPLFHHVSLIWLGKFSIKELLKVKVWHYEKYFDVDTYK